MCSDWGRGEESREVKLDTGGLKMKFGANFGAGACRARSRELDWHQRIDLLEAKLGNHPNKMIGEKKEKHSIDITQAN